MIELQILNKILSDKSLSLVYSNNLTPDHFQTYNEEFVFILDHFKKYNNIPDKETFLNNFREFEFVSVNESESYLIDTLNEEHLYYKSVPVVNKIAELLKVNSNDAIEYLLSVIPELTSSTTLQGVDLISQCSDRFMAYLENRKKENGVFIGTGLPELDKIVSGGWRKGEELVTVLARTNQGKSWLLNQFAASAWLQGNRVGIYSGEMSANMVGYRIDTLLRNFSNEGLMKGNKEEFDEYSAYIQELQQEKIPLVVVTQKELGGSATVSKLSNFIDKYALDFLVVDQYSLMNDDQYKRGDPNWISYSNITKGLMDISVKYKIPIIGAVQANRGGAKGKNDEGVPELEHASQSDAITHNSSKVVSMRQTGAGLELCTKKNRYGKVGDSVIYYWDIDKGKFKYIPSEKDGLSGTQSESVREKFKDDSDAF